jgi:integrase
MSEPLTDLVRRAAKPRSKPYEIRDAKLKGLILRVQPNGKKYFYAEWERGKRRRIPDVDDLTITQIRTQAKELMAQGKKGSIAPAKQNITLSKFLIEHYEPWAESNLKSGKPILKRIRACYGWLLTRPLTSICQWDVEKWRSQRLKDGKATTTVNRDLSAFKAALNKAVEWELLDANPVAKLKLKKVDTLAKARYLSDDEESRLRAALNAREERLIKERESGNRWRQKRNMELLPTASVDYLRVMVLVSLNTGLRKGELYGLRWDNVDLGTRILTVEGGGAKSGRTRHVPMNDEVLSELNRWANVQTETTNSVFTGKTGKAFSDTSHSWHRVLREAGIERFRWHDMRHSFASKLVMKGVDLNTVRELLGHATLAMTIRYAHLAPEHRFSAVQVLNKNA